ncbi:MAG: transpeptidase family protein [Tannerellaceae bacterium]|jgi:cell division protein FtsI (penicillin-binding protein 3)|nr:transpeptidase family protein [Tannerellaceae bacterium]
MDPNNNASRILSCYFITVILLGLVAFAIVFKAAQTALVEHDKWIQVAQTLQRPDRTVHPTRGNIYSHDGKLMAVSIPSYYLYIDFRADGFRRDSFLHSPANGIDSLALRLAHTLNDRSPNAYRAHLLNGFHQANRQFLISPQRVSYAQLKLIRSFPFLRLGRMRSGFYTRELAQRQKPFGTLASRTIGDIYAERGADGFTRGKNGLELHYDSLLRGEPGLSSVRRVGNAWTNVTEIEPLNGFDIHTTIDIRIQDIAEKALLDKLQAIDAESGTAIVMDVPSGEIKAITNLDRLAPGLYAEAHNHAVADENEPGSTFKVASMIVALEDGVCQPNDFVDTGNGVFIYAGARMTDHNADRGGYGTISAAEVIRYSSNIGMAKIILNGYKDHPEKFVQGLYKLGLTADLNVEIPGAGKAKIRMPDKDNWSGTALPWMSFGYETRIPPLNILTFFNAIANNGRMVRPRFTTHIARNGNTLITSSVETIKFSICSRSTLNAIHLMLIDVVQNGTGIQAKSELVPIAGKTGTAQIASPAGYRSTGHQVSFCGYFPAHKPRYSCIVVIRKPRIGTPSGGFMAGTVLKAIAEKTFAGQDPTPIRKLTPDSNAVLAPRLSAHADKPTIPTQGLVPNVVGLGARDAVFLLESAGLRVTLAGIGYVSSQSIPPGRRVAKGNTISIVLR